MSSPQRGWGRPDRDASPPSPPADMPKEGIPGHGWQRRRRRRRRPSPCPYERLSAARAVAAAAGDAAAAAATVPSTRSAMRYRARQRALQPALEGAVVASTAAVAEAVALLPSLRREHRALRAAVAAIECFNRDSKEGGEDRDGGRQGAPPPSPSLLQPPPPPPPPPPPLPLPSLPPPAEPLPRPSPQQHVPEMLPQLPLSSDAPSPVAPPPLWTPPVQSTAISLPYDMSSPPEKPLSPMPRGLDDSTDMHVDMGALVNLWAEGDPASSGDFVDGDGSGLICVNGRDGVVRSGGGGSDGDGRGCGGAVGGASRMENDLLDDLLWETPEVMGWPPRCAMPDLASPAEGGCGGDSISEPPPVQPMTLGAGSRGGGGDDDGDNIGSTSDPPLWGIE